VASAPPSAEIGDYFAACMDVDAVEKVGSAPLRPILRASMRCGIRGALGAWVGELQARTASGGMFFAAGVEQDAAMRLKS